MRTLGKITRLWRDTAALWWRHLPTLLFFAALGVALQLGGLYATVALGQDRKVVGTLVFVAGCIGWLACQLWLLDTLRPPVGPRESRIDVALRTIGPVLGIYAVWGLVDGWFQQLIQANIARTERFINRGNWSISLEPDQWRFYAVVWALTLIVHSGVRWCRNRWRWLGLPLLYLEGLRAWSGFMAALLGLETLAAWAETRAGVRNLWRLRDGVLAALPDWHIADWLLADALVAAVAWVGGTLLPAIWQGIALPAMWIALTAIVFRAGDAVSDEARWRRGAMSGSPWARLLHWATGDLRAKYLPLLRALRLLARPGLSILAAYLLAAVALDQLETWSSPLVYRLAGIDTTSALVQTWPLLTLARALLFLPLVHALRATVTREALAAEDTADLGSPRPVSTKPVDEALTA